MTAFVSCVGAGVWRAWSWEVPQKGVIDEPEKRDGGDVLRVCKAFII
jgi:hypothetical protein